VSASRKLSGNSVSRKQCLPRATVWNNCDGQVASDLICSPLLVLHFAKFALKFHWVNQRYAICCFSFIQQRRLASIRDFGSDVDSVERILAVHYALN